MTTRGKRGLTRRQLLIRSGSTAALAGLGTLAKPYLSRAADRPQLRCGIQSGDVSDDAAVIWSRADRAARMQVECAADGNFKSILRTASMDAVASSDFTAKLLLDGLPRDRTSSIASALNHPTGLPAKCEPATSARRR